MSAHLLIVAGYMTRLPSHAHKLAMQKLCDSADDRTRIAYPGLEALQLWVGVSRSRTLEILKELQDLGEIMHVTRGHRGRRAEYKVFPAPGDEVMSVAHREGSACPGAHLFGPLPTIPTDEELGPRIKGAGQDKRARLHAAGLAKGPASRTQTEGSDASDPMPEGSDTQDPTETPEGSDVPDPMEEKGSDASAKGSGNSAKGSDTQDPFSTSTSLKSTSEQPSPLLAVGAVTRRTARGAVTAPPAREDQDFASMAAATFAAIAWRYPDAPPSIRRAMNYLIRRALAVGLPPYAIEHGVREHGNGEDLPQGKQFDHLAAILKRLQADLKAGDLCPECGAEHAAKQGPDCSLCRRAHPQNLDDELAELTEAELAELAAAAAYLTGETR